MPRKIDEKTRGEIKTELENNEGIADIARKHGVHPNTVRRVKEELEKENCDMQMSTEEILRMYREAADKKKQVKILAELNATTEERIARILAANAAAETRPPLPTGAAKPKNETRLEELTPQRETPPSAESRLDISEGIFAAMRSILESGAEYAELKVTLGGIEISASIERRKA